MIIPCWFVATVGMTAPPNFVDDIQPIFKEHCLSCHNPDKKKADLDLTTVQGVQIGSSGGEVVKAGVPDTSVLYMVMNHHEDFDPMPPKKPKVPEAQLKAVHAWIAGGLIESKDGKSQLREMSFDLTKGSAERPKNPAVPTNLPEVKTAVTRVSPPIIAMAASPWADVVATSGHEQIFLFGKSENEVTEREPVAPADLVSRLTFDDEDAAGKFGNALFVNNEPVVDESVPINTIQTNGAFTFSAWIKPDASMKSATVYGNPAFYFFIESRGSGWTTRMMARDKNNGIKYFGRVGAISAGEWSHVAVTCDGDEWIFYHNGTEVVRQKTPEKQVGFLDRGEKNEPVYIGGDGQHADRNYYGGIDDLAFYKRALTAAEIVGLMRTESPNFAHVGTLPFAEGAVHDLRFSRNGDLLVAAGGEGGKSGKVVVFDVKTGARQAEIGDEQDIVLSADISADHEFVAVGTPSKLVKIFSAKDGKMLHKIEKHTDWVTIVRFSPDGKLLATGDRNGGIYIWETSNGGIVYTLDEHKVRVTGLTWRSDGQVLASAGDDGQMVLWDMKDGWPTRTATAHAGDSGSRYSRRTGVLDLDFASDGRILSTGRDRALKIWKVDGTEVGAAEDLKSLPTRGAFGANGTVFFTGDLAGKLHVWDAETRSILQTLEP